MNKQKLIEFEKIIADKFNNKEIRSPIHLYHGNEKQILKVFKKIDIKNDWVCCTWRNHYQCLLKGVPQQELIDRIISGKSMVMNICNTIAEKTSVFIKSNILENPATQVSVGRMLY